MCIVKTFCENTQEGISYLEYNGYTGVKRISNTSYFICNKKGNALRDVTVAFKI